MIDDNGAQRGMTSGDIINTSSTGSGDTHTHSFTGTAINLAVKYVDVCLFTKD